MNQLLPIIRRKRRPLVVADAPLVVIGEVAPGKIEPRERKEQTAKPQALECADSSALSAGDLSPSNG
jgi:hypothetical protein